MKLTCPACGASASLEAWQSDPEARAALLIVAALPREAAPQAVRYLAFFRPKTRGLSWDRAGKLLNEVKVLVESRELNWDAKGLRRITPAIWAQALERMLSRPPSELPLTSHNYLKAIAWAIANEADAARESARTQAENNGTWNRRGGGGEVKSVGDVLEKIASANEAAEPVVIAEDPRSIMGTAKRLLAERVSRASFEMWINPLKWEGHERGTARLTAPNAFAARYARENFTAEIVAALHEAAEVITEVSIEA